MKQFKLLLLLFGVCFTCEAMRLRRRSPIKKKKKREEDSLVISNPCLVSDEKSRKELLAIQEKKVASIYAKIQELKDRAEQLEQCANQIEREQRSFGAHLDNQNNAESSVE